MMQLTYLTFTAPRQDNEAFESYKNQMCIRDSRSRLDSFTGIGDEKALNVLKKVHDTFGVPTVTAVSYTHLHL